MTGSVPNGGITPNEVWTPQQWIAAWQAKADDQSVLNPAATLTGAEIVDVTQAGTNVRTTVGAFGAAGTYTPPFTGGVARTVAAKLGETVSLLDFGLVVPPLQLSFFDSSQTIPLISLIGNAGVVANNLWLSYGTASTANGQIGTAFEHIASGGGVFNNDNYFGVALYAAAKLTGGSRPIYAFNAVTEVDIPKQASAIGMESDLNNNSGTDCGLTNNAFDQMNAFRAASGGTQKAQVAYQTFTTASYNRFRVGASFVNWSDYGLVIWQDPGTFPFSGDASGMNISSNTGTGAGPVVTGPCILLQPSSDGVFPTIRQRNAANTADAFVVLQNGTSIHANNADLQWVGSDAVARTAVFVSGADNAYFMSAKTSGQLANQALQPAMTWGAVSSAAALSFFGGGLVNQITGYGTPTGGSRAALVPGSATLTQVNTLLNQLILDLKTYGMVAA